MNAYFEDLRKKIVETKERGMPNVEVACTFGVGLSSVKRYAKVAWEGGSLRPKRSPGRRPKADERARRLLKEDLRERSAATLLERCEYLRSVAGLGVSESTVSRLLRRMGWTRKKRRMGASERELEFLRATWQALVAGEIGAERLVFVDEMGSNTSLAPVVHAWTPRGERACCSVPRNRGNNTTLLASMTSEGMGPCLAIVGSTTAAVFEAYVGQALAPALQPGQVLVLDNLGAHKGERVRDLIEERGCELLFLPPYSPDLNPSRRCYLR